MSSTIPYSEIMTGPMLMMWDITFKCIFRCLHCYNNSGEKNNTKNEIDDNGIMKIANDIIQLKPTTVCLCGGEPLIRKKIVMKVINSLSRNDIRVSMVSNGYLINRDIAADLAKNGLDLIQISLDGSSQDIHEKLRGKKQSFLRALDAIRFLKDSGVMVHVAFVPTKFNIEKFEEYVSLVETLGIDAIRVQPIMILGRAQKYKEMLQPSPVQYRTLVEKIKKFSEEKNNINIEWGDPTSHFRYIDTIGYKYCEIKADGNITVSAYLPITFGNLKRYSFPEYWDAKLCDVGKIPAVKQLAESIKCVDNLAELDPNPYYDDYLKLDLIDDKQNVFKTKLNDII